MRLFSERIRLMRSALAKAAYLDDYINDSVRYQIVKQNLLSLALRSEDMGISAERIADKELVVSLTTHSYRINTVYQAIESIFQQSVRPNRIILYLNKKEFSLSSIPYVLRRQCDRGLEMRFVDDIGAYTKLLPALAEFPDAIIITIDDDYMYPYDMVERLINAYNSYPNVIPCFHSRQIELKHPHELAPYSSYKMCFPEHDTISMNLMAEGFGGVLYPPNSLHEDVNNISLIKELSPKADDLWFKAMQLLKSTPVLQLSRNRSWFQTITSESSVQDIALTHININQNANDRQLKAIFDHYDLYHMIKTS